MINLDTHQLIERELYLKKISRRETKRSYTLIIKMISMNAFYMTKLEAIVLYLIDNDEHIC
jgi:hypothetical protein